MTDMTTHDHADSTAGEAGGAGFLVRDPVCGMEVDPHQAAGQAEHRGATYYFCSPGCQAKFEADQDRYLQAEPQPPAAATARERLSSTPARCTRRSGARVPAHARSAGWRSNRSP